MARNLNIDFDISDFVEKSEKFSNKMAELISKGVGMVAEELMRLSQLEVPHDTGMLQNSGEVKYTVGELEAEVSYNRVYAARLHEHPEYNFQKGRKGKYLEDPMKHNLSVFREFRGNTIKQGL
jgi:hypothetical protein